MERPGRSIRPPSNIPHHQEKSVTTVDRIIDLATAYAHAAVRADRDRAAARSAVSPKEKAAATAAVEVADSAVDNVRAALRADLHQALEMPVRALPDSELPSAGPRRWNRADRLRRRHRPASRRHPVEHPRRLPARYGPHRGGPRGNA
jgi:hypothetical protein